jgi:hypothetical protein
MKEGPYVYGLAYLVGTAGDRDSDFHGAQELVYNPKGYDVYAIPNVWDKPNQGRPNFAFFTPAYIVDYIIRHMNPGKNEKVIDIYSLRIAGRYNQHDLMYRLFGERC